MNEQDNTAARAVMMIVTSVWLVIGLIAMITVIASNIVGNPMGGTDAPDLIALAAYTILGGWLVYGWNPLLFPAGAKPGSAPRRARIALVAVVILLPLILTMFLLCVGMDHHY